MTVRRVVTGHRDGKAVFASDEQVAPFEPPIMPGSAFVQLWGGDAAPTFPDDGSMPAYHPYFPKPGGFRFGLFTVAPHDSVPAADVDVEAGMASIEANLPGLLGHMEPDEPGMHTTDTVDFEYVLSGEVILELDDGAEVHLKPGDTVVQNGTRHRWRNPGTVPCTMVLFICGAHRA